MNITDDEWSVVIRWRELFVTAVIATLAYSSTTTRRMIGATAAILSALFRRQQHIDQSADFICMSCSILSLQKTQLSSITSSLYTAIGFEGSVLNGIILATID